MSVDWSFTEILRACGRYTELENKHIQLELDLKLVQENFTKAKEEAKGMFGENLDDCPNFLSILESDLIVIF